MLSLPQEQNCPETTTELCPPITLASAAEFGGQQLNQRETATAVYLFEDGIRILDPLTVHYGAASSDRWEQALRELERERASVLARAAQGNP